MPDTDAWPALLRLFLVVLFGAPLTYAWWFQLLEVLDQHDDRNHPIRP